MRTKAKGYGGIAGLEELSKEEIKARNLETYGSKVKKYRTRAGLSVEQLAGILKISVSSVRNWECGLTRPDPEYLYRMFTILDVEPNTFFEIGGVGNLLADDEKDLLDSYRALDPSRKADLRLVARTLADSAHEKELQSARIRMRIIPDMERRVAAGRGEEWPDYPESVPVVLYSSSLVERADEIITVSGDSMEPQFHDHDRVLVQYCSDLRCGDIGIFYVSGFGGLIKQKMHDRLHSLNPEYDDIFPYEEGARVIGRVIGKLTKDMIATPADTALYEEAMETSA